MLVTSNGVNMISVKKLKKDYLNNKKKYKLQELYQDTAIVLRHKYVMFQLGTGTGIVIFNRLTHELYIEKGKDFLHELFNPVFFNNYDLKGILSYFDSIRMGGVTNYNSMLKPEKETPNRQDIFKVHSGNIMDYENTQELINNEITKHNETILNYKILLEDN